MGKKTLAFFLSAEFPTQELLWATSILFPILGLTLPPTILLFYTKWLHLNPYTNELMFQRGYGGKDK